MRKFIIIGFVLLAVYSLIMTVISVQATYSTINLSIKTRLAKQAAAAKEQCEDMSEILCSQTTGCRGLYAPSLCSSGVCTGDLVFQECRSIPEEALIKAVKEKALCSKTGGNWREGKFAKPGRCECIDSYYRQDIGCLTMRDECENYEGKFYEAGNLACNQDLMNANSLICTPTSKYNLYDLCICGNGNLWNYKTGCE